MSVHLARPTDQATNLSGIPHHCNTQYLQHDEDRALASLQAYYEQTSPYKDLNGSVTSHQHHQRQTHDHEPHPANPQQTHLDEQNGRHSVSPNTPTFMHLVQTQSDDKTHETISKRTLQNRRAQREFRERRANYLKMLEAKVRHYESRQVANNMRVQNYIRRLTIENAELRAALGQALSGQNVSDPSMSSLERTPPTGNDLGSSGGAQLPSSSASLKAFWAPLPQQPADIASLSPEEDRRWSSASHIIEDATMQDYHTRRWSSASRFQKAGLPIDDCNFEGPAIQELSSHWTQLAGAVQQENAPFIWNTTNGTCWPGPPLSFSVDTSSVFPPSANIESAPRTASSYYSTETASDLHISPAFPQNSLPHMLDQGLGSTEAMM